MKWRTHAWARTAHRVGLAALLAGALGGVPADGATLTTLIVPLTGIVDGPPESVSFSGKARIEARSTVDEGPSGSDKVVLSIDLSQVVGIGFSTGRLYVATTREVLNRPLRASDLFEVSFVFCPKGQGGGAARVGVASFNLGFDLGTGRLVGADALIVPVDLRETALRDGAPPGKESP